MSSESPRPGSHSVLDGQIRGIADECIRLRRKLHLNPELALNEKETAATISSFLSSHGLKPRSFDFPSVICDTGPNPTVAIRADMDALPISENSGEEFSSSREGVMHACGHDAHSAILACSGVLLAMRANRSVRLIFQPAEETGTGAKMMIASGALDGIESVFGLHVWPSLDTGTLAILKGPAMAANSLFTARLTGSGGHGAYPHLAHDTVTAASLFVMNANTIVSRNIDPLESAVVSFGQINGGNAPNVIPAEISLSGTIRSFNPEIHKGLKQMLQKKLQESASSFQLEHAMEWYSEGLTVMNDPAVAERLVSAISPEVKVVKCNPTMGSEDFAYYLQKVKGAFAFLGTGGNEATRRSKHSSVFRLDEQSLYYGMAAEVLAGENI